MNNKITTTALLSLLMAGGAFAQTFSDDFEGFNAGDNLAATSADWSTWGGSADAATDVQIVTDQVHSGSNSIYLQSSADGGGPDDIILPFGSEINTGTMAFETWMRVESGKGAYFNFQGNIPEGGVWALDCQIDENGDLVLSSGGVNRATTSITHDTWFKININADLNTNSWTAELDGVEFGSFTNATYQVASVNLYPVNPSNNQSGYWVDDISFDFTSYTPTALNASVTNTTIGGNIAGTDQVPTIEVRNLGTSTVTSFDISILYNGNTITKSVSGENIAQDGTISIEMDDAFTIVAGSNDMVTTISNVNGLVDDNALDNIKTVNIDPVVPAQHKIVIGEEGTGTWCGWCPRGAVALEHMEKYYHDLFIGIAVHNGVNDPMVHEGYDSGIGALISGYPSGLVDRQSDIDPGAFESNFLERVVTPTSLKLEAGAEYNATNDSIYISLGTEFLDNVTGNYKIALVITEDSITGTESGYAQSNYYSGGGEGEMGGFESLGNPVPANQMVYNHVARMISPSFQGLNNSYPTSVTSGEMFTHTWQIAIDPEWDLDQIHIVGMVMAPDGKVENGVKATLADAITTGYTSGGTNVAGIQKFESPSTEVSIYPNPSSTASTVNVTTASNEALVVSVVDINGKVVYTEKVSANNGTAQVILSTENYAKGVYNVKVEQGQSLAVRKLVVE